MLLHPSTGASYRCRHQFRIRPADFVTGYKRRALHTDSCTWVRRDIRQPRREEGGCHFYHRCRAGWSPATFGGRGGDHELSKTLARSEILIKARFLRQCSHSNTHYRPFPHPCCVSIQVPDARTVSNIKHFQAHSLTGSLHFSVGAKPLI